MPTTLTIECATEACSTALFDGDELVAGSHEVLGRGHAERLVPMIAELPGRGQADLILVSLGPGSFTGVRIGLATARALGFAWQAQVIGYPTLALVAHIARGPQNGPVSVCMSGGHGEWFVQNFSDAGLPEENLVSLPPHAAARACRHRLIAGSQAAAAAALLDDGREAVSLLPDARASSGMRQEMFLPDLSPLYGRPPDARIRDSA